MQLRNARLCLNCEEVHAASHCPVCTSDSFAYVSRWIPPEERRQAPRIPQGAPRPQPPARRPDTGGLRWVKRGAAGVAVVAASRLLWNWSRPVEWSDTEVPEDIEPAEAPAPED